MNSCSKNNLFQQPVWLGMVRHGKGFVVAGEATDGEDVAAGATGATWADAIGSGMADVIGTWATPLTPTLPISVEASGIPVLATPPATSGEVAVGVEDDARLPEPAPHMPDNPEVSGMPEVGATAVDVEIPEVAPSGMPPPSKLAVDPNIADGALPSVEHIAPLGVAFVVAAGTGLRPEDVISVEPNGIPTGATAEAGPVPNPMPSGEVAPMTGVGVAIAATWASAALQSRTTGMIAATSAAELPRRAPASFAAITRGVIV
jgi:hypothetical protein